MPRGGVPVAAVGSHDERREWPTLAGVAEYLVIDGELEGLSGGTAADDKALRTVGGVVTGEVETTVGASKAAPLHGAATARIVISALGPGSGGVALAEALGPEQRELGGRGLDAVEERAAEFAHDPAGGGVRDFPANHETVALMAEFKSERDFPCA